MATGLALAVDGDVRPLGAYARLEWLAAPHRAASPSVRVSVARTGATRAVPIGGTLDLTWTLAAADACVNWPIDASALVGVCASVAAGNLTFAPTGVPRGSELSHRWLGLGAGLRYQARLTERLFTDVGLDLASPVTRHTAFVVAANGEHLEVYRPVFLQATVHLGVGVDFP